MTLIKAVSMRQLRSISDTWWCRAAACRLFLLPLTTLMVALISITQASADLVSPYGGETAPNFAELIVSEDKIRIVLEIDTSDYPIFVASDDGSGRSLAQRTGRTLTVEVDGKIVEPVIRKVDLRDRKPRLTAARPVVRPRPRSEQVIYAELDYPLSELPRAIAFTPPLHPDGTPLASIGMLAEHMGVPVTDYRYWGQREVLVPDWADPWFSRFENPNLTRHHKSPLMSFLSMEPREVRHEIIFRLRDLESWVDLGLGDATFLDSEQMAGVGAEAARFFAGKNPVMIDGVAVEPEHVRVSQISVGVDGLKILEDQPKSSRSTALLGIVLFYPNSGLPETVTMTWNLFPEGVDAVPVTLSDPAGGVPAQVRPGDATSVWKNYLTNWENPEVAPVQVTTANVVSLPFLSIGLAIVAVGTGWVAVRSNGRARILTATLAAMCLSGALITLPLAQDLSLPGTATPDETSAHAIMNGMLANFGAAMLETQPTEFETALATFVPADRRPDVASELRRGLSVTLPSGALARTEEIVDLQIESITPGETRGESQILVNWTASVSGGHWGHLHRRLVSYRGLVDISRTGDEWYLLGLTVLSAQTKG